MMKIRRRRTAAKTKKETRKVLLQENHSQRWSRAHKQAKENFHGSAKTAATYAQV